MVNWFSKKCKFVLLVKFVVITGYVTLENAHLNYLSYLIYIVNYSAVYVKFMALRLRVSACLRGVFSGLDRTSALLIVCIYTYFLFQCKLVSFCLNMLNDLKSVSIMLRWLRCVWFLCGWSTVQLYSYHCVMSWFTRKRLIDFLETLSPSVICSRQLSCYFNQVIAVVIIK